MNEYFYNGPVLEFDTCITPRWKASTYAVSEEKARSNFAFQFKKKYHKYQDAKIDLPGKITMVKRGGDLT